MTVRESRKATRATSAPSRPVRPPESGIARATRKLHAAMEARPQLDYTMIRTIVLILAGLGVVMVMSSSMATSFAVSSSVWSQALRQTVMVAVGLFAFWVALKTPPEQLRRFSGLIMILSVLLLIAVLIPGIGTGKEEVGSQSWIVVGPLRLQPSEVARVAIAIWGAQVLAGRDPKRLFTANNGFPLFLTVAAICIALIAMQGDLGMAVSFSIVVAFILLFAGVSLRAIGLAAFGGALVMLFEFLSGGFRSNRFHVYFDALFGKFEDTRGVAFQSHQGFLSLADGSLFGVGLGQSRAKWFYLPEARNDFIFAVIGEELGLWGGALVIILFALLGYFGLRTARRAQNQFQSLMAAALTAGVVSQAFINIGYVVGLLPVTGIQLPMLSAGGTSAIITLAGMGVLASVARHEPDAISSMQNHGRPAFDRMLGIGEPKTPAQTRARRDAAAAAPSRAPRPPRRSQPRNTKDREARYGTPVTATKRASASGSPSRVQRAPRYDGGRRTTPSDMRRAG
ncbi:putative lipid II flippase FtsW [Corynebacterium sp. TA-R-1]|uniref:Probable peptidoglycan glycosyltransferase FtsW n=1 Tax=Corynebacterium stercoris TaxID=2943490 RepID=A0ABT1G1X3_9CORY|nr:putative peptidoglycan glycosyltransferase FtsW [Corynebacterium stercoris]MCP1386717.1 putative lipid II flippase FtsW [Corynebacterium stercoris]